MPEATHSRVDQARVAQAPDYRIAIGDTLITPAIRPRLVSLAITDSRGGTADQLTLELDDADGALALPRTGVVVAVELGWRTTGLAPVGQFTVDEIAHSGTPDTIHVRARSADLRASLPGKRTRSWEATTLGAIVDAIAARHQLTPAIAARLAQTVIDHIDQTAESDANFLTRLGARYDAIAAIKAGRLVFAPAGQAQTVTGAAMPAITLTRADGDSHSYRVTDRDTYSGVIAYYRDTAAAKRVRVTAGDPDDKPKTLRDTYPTQAEAQAAANGEWQRLQRGERAFDLTLARGRADLTTEIAVNVTGFKPEINAIPWVITEVEHRLDPSSYTNSLKMERRGA